MRKLIDLNDKVEFRQVLFHLKKRMKKATAIILNLQKKTPEKWDEHNGSSGS